MSSESSNTSTSLNTVETPQIKPANLTKLDPEKIAKSVKSVNSAIKKSKKLPTPVEVSEVPVQDKSLIEKSFFDNFDYIFKNKYFWIVVFIILCLITAIYYYQTYIKVQPEDKKEEQTIEDTLEEEKKQVDNKEQDKVKEESNETDDEFSNITKKDLIATILTLQNNQQDLQDQLHRLKKNYKTIQNKTKQVSNSRDEVRYDNEDTQSVKAINNVGGPMQTIDDNNESEVDFNLDETEVQTEETITGNEKLSNEELELVKSQIN